MPYGVDLANPTVLRRFATSGDRRYPAVVAAIELRWTFDVTLPEGFRYAAAPAGRAVRSDAASFESQYRVESERRMWVERTLRVAHDVFPPEQYAGLRDALNAAESEARTVLVATRVR